MNLNSLYSPQKLLSYMDKNINYGYLKKDGHIEENDYNNFYYNYKLQSPEELYKNKVGVCWDQVELERYVFENKIHLPYKTYYIICNNKESTTHTFLVYTYQNDLYYFESSFEIYRGLYKFKDINSIIKFVIRNIRSTEINKKDSEFDVYEYKKPEYGIGAKEFMDHCENGKKELIK